MKSDIDTKIIERCKKIKLILLDVDGVLTEGGVIYGGKGEELKIFDVKDGLGIKLAQAGGLKVGILSGRASPALEKRASDLEMDVFFQGQRNKSAGLEMVKRSVGIEDDEIAYVGDDLNDLPVLERVGLRIAVQDAVERIKNVAHYVTEKQGGKGAVREVVELILQAQDKMEIAIEKFLKM